MDTLESLDVQGPRNEEKETADDFDRNNSHMFERGRKRRLLSGSCNENLDSIYYSKICSLSKVLKNVQKR